MKKAKSKCYLFSAIGLSILLFTCTTPTYFFRSDYNHANKLVHETSNLITKPFLKVHMKNGDVYILMDCWKIDTILNTVEGNGSKYNYNRRKIYDGPIAASIDSVAMFETNDKLITNESERIAQLTLMGGVDVLIGIICLTNPKACFGSCPTFYINENDNLRSSDAEGFSEAIRPSMEYFDIDALNNHEIKNGNFSITMKNEALETHCVNDVKLYAYPLQNGERVYQTPENNFYLCENSYILSSARGNEGDITNLLLNHDKNERYSLSDEKNMSSKEEIYMNFENVENSQNLGLILNFRQTLMTTYLIYTAIGYMGNEVGDIFAKMETEDNIKEKVRNGIKKELVKIEVYAWNESKKEWILQNAFYEVGPIAINKQMIPLNDYTSNGIIKLKLVLNKGLWRIDYAGLTNIKEQVNPLQLSTTSVLNKGVLDSKALEELLNPEKHLISMPGSEYKLKFSLPEENKNYELFLYSKGYYLEWMRENWLKDKNLLKLKQMVNNPKKYLRKEAKVYKKYESSMEQIFWNSLIDTKKFNYNEK